MNEFRWAPALVLNVLGARPLSDCGWAASLDGRLQGDVLSVEGWVLQADAAVRRVELWWADQCMGSAAVELPSTDVAGVYGQDVPGAQQCRVNLECALPGQTQDSVLLTVHAVNELGWRMHVASVICRRQATPGLKVFVVGSPRSGTTVVGNALREALALPNYGEAHVLPLLHGQIEALDRQLMLPFAQVASRSMQNMLAHVSAEVLREQWANNFRSLYRSLHAGSVFCDKTPGEPMLRALPVAAWLWPDARFIFCRRRGMDNVASRLRKFAGADGFEGHCQDWALTMRVGLEMRAMLPEANWLEVDQFDLEINPQAQAERLAQWLGLTPPQAAQALSVLTGPRPEQTQSQQTQARALDEMGWTPEQVATFRVCCADMMQAWGYAESADYRL